MFLFISFILKHTLKVFTTYSQLTSYPLYLQGLYLRRAWFIPWMAAIAIASDSNMKTKLNVLSPSHLIAPFFIFFLAMYISTGKYTVIGQNPMAPKRASISLKKGIAMARIVTAATNMVLQTSLKKLRQNFILPMIKGYSLLIKLELGHLSLAHVSTAPKIGWTITYHNLFILLISKLIRTSNWNSQKEKINNLINLFHKSYIL